MMASTQFENVPSVEKLVTDLQDVTEMSRSDRVFSFIMLCNQERLIELFKKQSMMQQLEMSLPDDVYSFAYGVLKLASPHLFEKSGE